MVHGFIAGYLIVRYARFLAWLMAWCLAGFLVALPSGLGWVALAGFGVFGWKCRQARLARVYRHARARADAEQRAEYERMWLQAELNADALARRAYHQEVPRPNDGYRYVAAG